MERQEHSLLIVGAGDLGQAVAEIAFASGAYQNIAFLDDAPNQSKQEQAQIIGRIDNLQLFTGLYSHTIVAIGNNQKRREIRLQIKKTDMVEPVIIHPSAVISPTVAIGNGTIVRENVVLSRKVRIGEGVILNIGVLVDHNCVIGDNTHLPMGTIVRNNVQIPELSVYRPRQVIE